MAKPDAAHHIKKKALELGVDAVACLSLEDYSSARSPAPDRYLAGARSLVVFLLRELRGGYMNQSIIRMSSLGGLEQVSLSIGYSLSRFVEDEFDAEAMMIPGHRPFEISDETVRSIIGPISLRHAAVQCGLGALGRNGLLVTPKWGSMVRIGAILTTLRLPTDRPGDAPSPCKNCRYPCVARCPAGAITLENGLTIVNQAKCTRYSQPYDVGNYMRFMLRFIGAGKTAQMRMVLTPHWFNLYMAGMGYMYYRCIECTRGCPGTHLKKEFGNREPSRPEASTLSEMLRETAPLALQKFRYQVLKGRLRKALARASRFQAAAAAGLRRSLGSESESAPPGCRR